MAKNIWRRDESDRLGGIRIPFVKEAPAEAAQDVADDFFEAAGGPLTYNYTGTGGIVFAGVAGLQAGHIYAAAGGAVLGGAAAIQAGHVYLGSGGVIFSGQAGIQAGHQYVGAAGIVFSGAALIDFYQGQQAVVISLRGRPGKRRLWKKRDEEARVQAAARVEPQLVRALPATLDEDEAIALLLAA